MHAGPDTEHPAATKTTKTAPKKYQNGPTGRSVRGGALKDCAIGKWC